MLAVDSIGGATLISEFLAAIKAAQVVRLAGPRIEQGDGHNPAPHCNIECLRHDRHDGNGSCGRTKSCSTHRVRRSNAELPTFRMLVGWELRSDPELLASCPAPQQDVVSVHATRRGAVSAARKH
jgi:hypothetical protein